MSNSLKSLVSQSNKYICGWLPSAEVQGPIYSLRSPPMLHTFMAHSVKLV